MLPFYFYLLPETAIKDANRERDLRMFLMIILVIGMDAFLLIPISEGLFIQKNGASTSLSMSN